MFIKTCPTHSTYIVKLFYVGGGDVFYIFPQLFLSAPGVAKLNFPSR